MHKLFREVYTFPSDIVWFPGHMTKALKTVKGLCKNVDIVVEVRDARIPISSVNIEIEKVIQNKPRLILLHKSDLISKQDRTRLVEYYKQCNQQVLVTSAKTRTNMSAIIPALLSIKSNQFTTVGSYFAVMGIPNVGKSSIIGHIQKASKEFRRNKSPLVGGVPGVTKRVAATKVSSYPDVYMIDTPGIFLPDVKDPEVGLKMALCGSVKDSVVGEYEIADYLLFTLNQRKNWSYVQKLGITEPTDSLNQLIKEIMTHYKKDELTAARLFIRFYREGRFGLFLLDDFAYLVYSYKQFLVHNKVSYKISC